MKPAIETYQAPWELDQFLGLVGRRRTHRILEVGCWKGGTLWHWIQQADAVCAIDDQAQDADRWFEWANETGATLLVIGRSSHDPFSVETAQDFGPYDLIFIDADHTYEAVKQDWENYRPMLAPGGAIAFHDILPRPGYGVSQLWDEIKLIEGVRWVEICQNAVEPGNEGRCGIGVAWLP